MSEWIMQHGDTLETSPRRACLRIRSAAAGRALAGSPAAMCERCS